MIVFARGGYDGLNMVIPFMEESRYRAAEVRQGFLTLLSGLADDGPVVLTAR